MKKINNPMADPAKINILVEDTLNSIAYMERAVPRPYLLSRIHAQLLNKKETTTWDRLSSIITSPVVAFVGILLIVMLNIYIIYSNNANAGYNTTQQESTVEQGFSIAASTVSYDIENIQP